MDLELTDKVAVVTGASKGIGLAVTKMLADEGARVVGGARTVESLDGPRPRDRCCPRLGQAGSCPHSWSSAAIADHVHVDVLVNSVGAIRLRLDGFLATSDDDFEWAMQLNFFSDAARLAYSTSFTWSKQGAGVDSERRVGRNAFFQPDGATIDYEAAKAAAGEPRQVACPGVRGPGHSRELGVAGTGSDRPLARQARCGGDRRAHDGSGRSDGSRDDYRRYRWLRHRTVHNARRGGDARRVVGLRSHRRTSPVRTSSSTAASSRPRDHSSLAAALEDHATRGGVSDELAHARRAAFRPPWRADARGGRRCRLRSRPLRASPSARSAPAGPWW